MSCYCNEALLWWKPTAPALHDADCRLHPDRLLAMLRYATLRAPYGVSDLLGAERLMDPDEDDHAV